MIRVIYRWKVKEEDQAQFRAAWAKTTTGIREKTLEARGSILLHSQDKPTEFITMARWDRLEDWQAFWDEASSEDMKVMHSLAERLSVEAFKEIEDHTV